MLSSNVASILDYASFLRRFGFFLVGTHDIFLWIWSNQVFQNNMHLSQTIGNAISRRIFLEKKNRQ